MRWLYHQSSNFCKVALLFLSTSVTGPSSMLISSLVPELWQFSFVRDWSEIQKLEIPSSEFCAVSKDWGELQIPNLARIKISNKWLLNAAKCQVTDFIFSELLKENQHEGNGGRGITPTTQISVKVLKTISPLDLTSFLP